MLDTVGHSSWLIHQHKDGWKMSWQCWSWPSMGRLYSSEKEKHRKNRESCPSRFTHLAKPCEGQLLQFYLGVQTFEDSDTDTPFWACGKLLLRSILPPENNMVGHGSYNLVQGSYSEWLSILARWYRVIADKMSRKATRISSTTKRFDAIDNVDLLEARLSRPLRQLILPRAYMCMCTCQCTQHVNVHMIGEYIQLPLLKSPARLSQLDVCSLKHVYTLNIFALLGVYYTGSPPGFERRLVGKDCD